MWPKDKLTRFEVARILGARALQISLGAPILVNYKKEKFDAIEVAEEELRQCKVPMTIKRTLPNREVVVVDIKSGIKSWLEDHSGNL